MASNAVATSALLLTTPNRSALRSPQPIIERTATHSQTAAYISPTKGTVASGFLRDTQYVGQTRNVFRHVWIALSLSVMPSPQLHRHFYGSTTRTHDTHSAKNGLLVGSRPQCISTIACATCVEEWVGDRRGRDWTGYPWKRLRATCSATYVTFVQHVRANAGSEDIVSRLTSANRAALQRRMAHRKGQCD
jgi:hypothetical protein